MKGEAAGVSWTRWPRSVRGLYGHEAPAPNQAVVSRKSPPVVHRCGDIRLYSTRLRSDLSLLPAHISTARPLLASYTSPPPDPKCFSPPCVHSSVPLTRSVQSYRRPASPP